jgi:ubiquitin-activating enzyme E1
LKAKVATEAALAMNPAMKIASMTTKVAPETENVLNNPFWYSLDGVAGALDNFEARAYIDRRCLFFQYVFSWFLLINPRKPFVDSATTATQCTTKAVYPKRTASWVSGSAIPTEETFLVRNSPFPCVTNYSYVRCTPFPPRSTTQSIMPAISLSRSSSWMT